MARHIVRHFNRMDQPRATTTQIRWPGETTLQFPQKVQTVYAGDTLHVFGWLDDAPWD